MLSKLRFKLTSLLTGILFIAIGVGFSWLSLDYFLGDSANPGPGYYPTMISMLLTLSGLVIMFKAVKWKS